MQSKCVTLPQSLSSSLTLDSFKSRTPKFQRKKSSEKCECKSSSKSKISCDSISLQKFYVKNSFFKSTVNQCNLKDCVTISNLCSSKEGLIVKQVVYKSNYLLQNKQANCQFIEDPENINNLKFESYLHKGDESDAQIKEKIEKYLKQSIFYKEKYQKLESKIRSLTSEKQKYFLAFQRLTQENQRLKAQIQKLISKKFTQTQIFRQNLQSNLKNEQKGKVSTNNNKGYLSKQQGRKNQLRDLKIQSELHEKIEKLKNQNQRLRIDMIKQNELFNIKLKMMQQKQDFLQKTLKSTKNTIQQLQKHYNQRQLETFQSKRLHEMIKQKDLQLEKIESKYKNLLKILNGEKKRVQNSKPIKSSREYVNVPVQQKNKQSLDKFKHTLNKTINKCQQQTKTLKRNGSDLTLSSFNSFELSPQK